MDLTSYELKYCQQSLQVESTADSALSRESCTKTASTQGADQDPTQTFDTGSHRIGMHLVSLEGFIQGDTIQNL